MMRAKSEQNRHSTIPLRPLLFQFSSLQSFNILEFKENE